MAAPIDSESLFADPASAPPKYITPVAREAPTLPPPSVPDGVTVVQAIDGQYIVRVTRDGGTTLFEWRWERDWLEKFVAAASEVLG